MKINEEMNVHGKTYFSSDWMNIRDVMDDISLALEEKGFEDEPDTSFHSTFLVEIHVKKIS